MRYFSVLSSFAIILSRKRELVALLQLFSWCFVTVNVMWLFLTVPWVGLQCVIEVFPDQTHLLFVLQKLNFYISNELLTKLLAFCENKLNLVTKYPSTKPKGLGI